MGNGLGVDIDLLDEVLPDHGDGFLEESDAVLEGGDFLLVGGGRFSHG